MEFNFTEILAAVVPQLGFGAIFLWMFHTERQNNTKNVDSRDVRIKQLTDSLLDAYNENTRTMQEVKDTIAQNTRSIEQNTSAMQQLSGQIYQTMGGKQ
jgi:hypothetical protein